MVEILGTQESVDVSQRTITDVWRLPAMGKSQARMQARANSRLKGRNGFEVTQVERIEKGKIPGQKIYRVTVESEQ